MGDTPRITIIGGGISGIGLAMQLARAGIDSWQILEKAGDIGGTWRDNIYPGCACDVPSHLYSFSFEGRADWTRRFPSRAEVFGYLEGLARKYGIYDKTRFDTEIASAHYDAATNGWRLEATDGKTFETDILVMALGQLNRPKVPEIQGSADFKGALFHSAEWEYDHDLSGKRVAVIGNGPSAAQFIPEVAEVAGHLAVFQRSPCHVVPRMDTPDSPFAKFLFRYVPGFRRFYRQLIYWTLEKNFLGFNEVENVRPLVKMMSRMGDLSDAIERHFDEQVSDPHLREILRPDYPVGCKRVVISDDYYPALQRDNVSVETEAIEKITAEGILTRDGKTHAFDAIIYGTGFESTDFLAPLHIEGAGGVDLNTAWRDGAEAYLGITMPHFPNFFMLYGPNTNLGHNSIIFMVESQIRYILSAIAALGARRARAMDLREDKMAEFADYLKARLSTSVWERDCDSWYKNEAGKVTNNWPDFTYIYRQETHAVDPADYRFYPPENRDVAAE